MEMNIVAFFLAENGRFSSEMVDVFLKLCDKRGITVENMGIGSAYNMPAYLLDAIEENLGKAAVFSYYIEEEKLVPMVFIGEEVNALIQGLQQAEEGEDSFDIAKEMHRLMRS